MTAETVASHRPAPDWMHQPITAEEYDSLPEELCADIEIVDGMVVMSPSATSGHNRIARILANALDVASTPEWFADTDFDVRVRDIPLTNRRPDVVVYRAEAQRITPKRPEHVLLLVEVVSPGSETTDRITKPAQYAKAGIQYYWRVEQFTNADPKVFTYELDPETAAYRATEVFTGLVKATAPFEITADLTGL
ncbi:Uma2 family endonuclease [Kitasatospora sp. RB6PN24]|uniref:Uma2 family endonuclease n=1 Tax=Kitasatospora humi TaxID=2893891 RepID=UPI001E57C9E2|nr:Uma2 family endonuclease [Kitasatospora humi]MCC9308229.1 Uma2 family endonuclease [Kitasatospora humi]